MTKSYRLRGIEQEGIEKGGIDKQVVSSSIDLKHLRTLVPGTARDAGVVEVEAAGDEVVRIVYKNGFVMWSRADDLIHERGRKTLGRDGSSEVWEIDVRPSLRAGKGTKRGLLGIGIKVLEFFGVDLKDKTVGKLGKALEKKLLHGNDPELYRCSLEDSFSLTAIPKNEKLPSTPDQPILLFIHGTASSCYGSFGKLWESKGDAQIAARSKMSEIYAERVYAWEHRTLTESPIQNALELVKRLPDKTPIHLVTHSRGGLVGELLCLAQRDKDKDTLKTDTLESLFATDRTMAEQLGLGPLEAKAAKERNDAYDKDRHRLEELLELLDTKRFTIDRFVRVACPARGTTLASGRLDRWLSVLDFICGNGLFGDVADFLLALVKERTDPRTLPGLEAMMPGSAFTRFLHLPDLLTTSDLTVIAGDIEGDNLFGQIKLLAVDWFYGAYHDLVVNTGSMYGGLRRPEKGARFLLDKGAEVNHFSYFDNAKSVRWLVNGLTRREGADGGFQPLQEAKHEVPKWREAVRRSRAKTAPQPLAVVLPGTMGSELNAKGEEIWVNYWRLLRGGLKRLRKNAAGVMPTDILDDFYGPLLEYLTRSHRVEIFPYDWRLSVRDAASKLADNLEKWLPDVERTNQSVHLIAHSMGGLVVRTMLTDSGRGATIWRRITQLPNSRFLMLGTPNRGSYEAMRWLTGHNPTEFKLSLLDFTQSINDIIDIVRHYPGLLELLPFADDDPDFSQQSLWTQLKRELKAGWEPAELEALSDITKTWKLIKASKLDPERMIYVAGHQRVTVTDYQLSEDPDDPFTHGRKKLEYIATWQGDGTVTWKSGLLKEIETWYVENTAHDELCTKKRAFPGYLDLLTKGSTTLLKKRPSALSRAEGEPERFVLQQIPFPDYIPDERSARSFGFGPSRLTEEVMEETVLPIIRVSIIHGDLAYANHHVLVGHYKGDTIVSAEAALDKRLGNSLTQRMLLGIYPGSLKTHALFCNQKPDAKPAGALVIGLGQVGELSPGLLMTGVHKAMLDFALQMAQRPQKDQDQPSGVCALKLTCMLVGSGAGGVTVRDSIESILRGAVDTNEKLVDSGLDNKVLIEEIEFLELYEDVAIAAAEALEGVLTDGELATVVEWSDRAIKAGQGGRRRVHCDEAPDWWHRLEIIEEKGHDGLRFIATTDRARAEETQATGQLRLADSFIKLASQSPRVNAVAAKTLFEMLLPNRLKELAPRQTDLVLLVDEISARYPWELLEDRQSSTNRPPAVAAGLVRQLKSRHYRPSPAHANEAKAFVVGNPDLQDWHEFPDLPGARQEAHSVAALLAARGYFVQECIDENADSIINGLHSNAWRILHLAGHGEHEFSLIEQTKTKESCASCGQSLPEKQKRVSGMVIGYKTFLTPGDVEQMRWVPELVFINCCHLGKTLPKKPRDYNLLAANLAVQFIRMGVKAVVAAGWAVDDGAAQAFSKSFYTHLLDGYTFGDAVRAARGEIWVQYPGVNTWGAYQCYGDPSYRLYGNGKTLLHNENRLFHSPIELVAQLQNLNQSIRMESRDTSDAGDTLESSRKKIASLTERIPENQEKSWHKRGDVAIAYGLVWGELGDYAKAIDWLEKSFKAEKGDIPVRAIEQYANFQVRHAGEEWQQLQSAKASSHSEQTRLALIEKIKKAITSISFLCKCAPTVERFNLLGSAYKRLMQVHDDQKSRQKALVNMTNYYRRAYELSKEKLDLYSFTNWVLARALGESDLAVLRDECKQMIEIAQKRDAEEPSFWSSVAEYDLEVVILLAQPEITAEGAKESVERIISGYRDACKRGASPREMASVCENLDFIIAMSTSAPKPLRDALAAIRAAI
ncbi:MAG: CHAT domain-containing protein [bacterium]